MGYEVDPLPPAAVVKGNIRLGRALGADDLWFPDHVRHFLPKALWASTPMSRFVPDLDAWYDPTTVIARVCRRHGPRMGTLVTDAFRRTPSDLARAWLSMHHMSGGNVILGIGAGEAMNLEPIGQPMDRPVSRLEDTLSAVRAAWSADGHFVTHEGPFHSWKEASFPPPYRGTVPPIWVAAIGPRACGVAGRWGDGWIYMTQDFQNWQAAAARVAAGAEAAGKDPQVMEWNLSTIVMLSTDPKAVKKLCSSPLVKASALCMPGSDWSAIGATHPFGESFAGPFSYSAAKDGQLFEGEAFKEATEAVTPDLLEELFASGPATRVLEKLSPYVEQGVSHMITVNWGLTLGLRLGADSLREQAKLHRLLKRMSPGSRSWAKTYAPPKAPERIEVAGSAPSPNG